MTFFSLCGETWKNICKERGWEYIEDMSGLQLLEAMKKCDEIAEVPGHEYADCLLVHFLRSQGYDYVAEIYEKMPKWYE